MQKSNQIEKKKPGRNVRIEAGLKNKFFRSDYAPCNPYFDNINATKYWRSRSTSRQRKTVDLNYFYFTSSVGSAIVPSYIARAQFLHPPPPPPPPSPKDPLSSPPFFILWLGYLLTAGAREEEGGALFCPKIFFTEAEIVEDGEEKEAAGT